MFPQFWLPGNLRRLVQGVNSPKDPLTHDWISEARFTPLSAEARCQRVVSALRPGLRATTSPTDSSGFAPAPTSGLPCRGFLPGGPTCGPLLDSRGVRGLRGSNYVCGGWHVPGVEDGPRPCCGRSARWVKPIELELLTLSCRTQDGLGRRGQPLVTVWP
jgi:hypothetical protein